jgi:hypothetical protein
MRRSSSSMVAAATVMTIGELHAGHRIDPSLADAVKERNEIRCVERLRTRDQQARP